MLQGGGSSSIHDSSEHSETGIRFKSVTRLSDPTVRRPDSTWTVDATCGNVVRGPPAHDVFTGPSISDPLSRHHEVSPLADLAVRRPEVSSSADSALPSYTGTVLSDATQTGPLDSYDVQMLQVSPEETARPHDNDETARGLMDGSSPWLQPSITVVLGLPVGGLGCIV